MAERRSDLLPPFLVAAFVFALHLFGLALAATDPSDVGALQLIYTSLNTPPQLTGWRPTGGDPCGESWRGISCEGPAVTAIQVSGLGLNGTMGYRLSDLLSLKTLDVSNNNLHDSIPYQLPPNLTYLNIASNNFSGSFPYSISTMVSLYYLNVSRNSISMSVGDIFTNLQGLSVLDLSFNNLSGDLPNSFSSLSNISTLYLQNNQLTGQVIVLANLSLDNLNIANNNFSGWIPPQLKSIRNLIIGGNSFDNGPAPPPPPFTPSPRSGSPKRHNRTSSPDGSDNPILNPSSGQNDKKSLSTIAVVGIVVGSTLLAFCAIAAIGFCLWRYFKGNNKIKKRAGAVPFGIPVISDKETSKDLHQHGVKNVSSVTNLKPPPSDVLIGEQLHGKNGHEKRLISPITATSYSVASLQVATNSFSQECLVGEGALGRVYRAEFPTGKVLAVKKIDSAAISLEEEDNFLEGVSSMARLRHPNIVTLQGYCVEHGQRLLVYEYIANGTLHDMLHFTEDGSQALTWNARVRIALGTARALEYLHEVCLPSVVHRNFKSANILLDEDLNPHLSDSGLAALTPNTERQISTQMVGSFGYSAPEFAMSGVYTVKSDVYSFGVVMLELLTGRKPLDGSRIRSEQSLVRWATPQLHDIDALAKMIDPALNGMYPAKSLSRFADIIALCIQLEPEFRPPMSDVVQSLVRLMQRASAVKRHSSDDTGFSYRIPEHEVADLSF